MHVIHMVILLLGSETQRRKGINNDNNHKIQSSKDITSMRLFDLHISAKYIPRQLILYQLNVKKTCNRKNLLKVKAE